MKYCVHVPGCESGAYSSSRMECSLYSTADTTVLGIVTTNTLREGSSIQGPIHSEVWFQKSCYTNEMCKEFSRKILNGTQFIISRDGKDLFVEPETRLFEWRRKSSSWFSYNSLQFNEIREFQSGFCFRWEETTGLMLKKCKSFPSYGSIFRIAKLPEKNSCLWEIIITKPKAIIDITGIKANSKNDEANMRLATEEDFLLNLTALEIRFKLEKSQDACQRTNITNGEIHPSVFHVPVFFTGDKMQLTCNKGYKFVGNKRRGTFNRTYVCGKARQIPSKCTALPGINMWGILLFLGTSASLIMILGGMKLTLAVRKVLLKKGIEELQVDNNNLPNIRQEAILRLNAVTVPTNNIELTIGIQVDNDISVIKEDDVQEIEPVNHQQNTLF